MSNTGLHNKYIKKSLKIQAINVKNISETENSITFHIETNPKAHICPSCKEETSKIHDYRIQIIQHGSFNNNIIYLHLRKRRYICSHCGKRFYESYDFIQEYFRKSNNLYNKIISDAKMQKSLKTISLDNCVTIPTVNRYIAYNIFLSGKQEIHTLPEKISIDEFKGNTGEYKYQLQIMNLDTDKVVDIVKSRSYDDLEIYFSKIQNRKEVKLVTMDLYTPF